MKFLCATTILVSGNLALASLLAPWVGPNIRPGEDPGALPAGDGLNQAEPHVTRSAVDPDLILATFQEGRYGAGGGAVANGFAISRDGGFTWERNLNPNLTTVVGGPYYRATDPVAGIANDGTLYLNSLVSVDEAFGLGRIVMQRSLDSGQSWSAPVTIYTGSNQSSLNTIFPDKNWMVVNTLQGSPTEGRVIVTWTDFRTIKLPTRDIEDYLIMCAYSDDRGQTWSNPVFVTPPEGEDFSQLQYQGSQPVFLPRGDLAVVYHNFRGTRLEVRYSPDGGRTFPYGPDSVNDIYMLYDAPNMRDGTFLPSVAAAGETGDIYVAYTSKESFLDSFGYIYFVRSRRTNSDIPTGGAPDWNFSDPLNISGYLPVRITCTPTISVSPDGLRVTVFFYDNQNGSGLNDSGDFYCVQSVDGGATWTPPFRLSEATFPLNRATETNRGYMLGDYFGMAPPMGPDQAAVAVWVGTPLATADPWSARIADTGKPVMDSWIQANLSYRYRTLTGGDLYSDLDRDGAPLLVEYITGQSPMLREDPVDLGNNVSLLRIAPGTDTSITLDVSPGGGQWPGQWDPIAAVEETTSHGEGYWEEVSWPGAVNVEQVRFRIDNSEDWYLLKKGSPSRWVLDFGDGWVWSPWLGKLYTTHAPWLYHAALGWLYDLRGALYYPELDTYLMPSPRYHPWLYTSDGSYVYLYDALPWLYDESNSAWLRIDGLQTANGGGD